MDAQFSHAELMAIRDEILSVLKERRDWCWVMKRTVTDAAMSMSYKGEIDGMEYAIDLVVSIFDKAGAENK